MTAWLGFAVSSLVLAAPAVPELQRLTLEEKVGQLLIVGFRSWEQIERVKAGGVVLFSWNMKSVAGTRKLVQDIAARADQSLAAPLFVATDHEGGKVLRLRRGLTYFPDAAAMGSMADELTAFRTGKTMGQELSALGIGMNLAPVLDLGNAKSFLENRVWGERPELVGKLTGAFIEGLKAARIIPVAKHFPGHGASTGRDSHYELPRIDKSLERLWNEDFEPFRQVIQKNVPAIMTAHVEIPAVDVGPASLSKKFVGDLLQQKMGFQGLVITDDLEMGGAVPRSGRSVEDLSLDALRAGTDMLLVVWSRLHQEKIYRRIIRAVRAGEIPESLVDQKVAKILALKKRYLSPLPMVNPHWAELLDRSDARSLSRRIILGAIQWQAGNEEAILAEFRSQWSREWTVLLPSNAARDQWLRFRKHDRVEVLARRADAAAVRRVREVLRRADQLGHPRIVITGPRATSSEEIFSAVRTELSRVSGASLLPQAVLWVHQGAKPVEIRREPAALKIGLLSLFSSSISSLKALQSFLKQEQLKTGDPSYLGARHDAAVEKL